MSSIGRDQSDDECSVIGDKGEIGFIDYEDDTSVCCYDTKEEGPIVISSPFPFMRGKPQSIFVRETSVYPITLENTSSESVDLWAVTIFCSNPVDSFTISLLEPPSVSSDVECIRGFLEGFSLEDRVLQPNRTLTIWLSCKPKDIGLHTSIVHFDVGDDRIERVVFLLAEDKVSQSICTNKPYSRVPRRKPQNVGSGYVVSPTPTRAPNHNFKYKLLQYEIPDDVREFLEKKLVPKVIREGLRRENYANYFDILLIMEELHLEKEMRKHDMECVTMRRRGAHFLALEVPGLAERRPSLVHGDLVFAKFASMNPDNTTPSCQGFIYRVEADEVLLKFDNEFHKHHESGFAYSIRFTYNRANMRRLYQAVQKATSLDSNLLFPSEWSKRSIEPNPFVPFTALNEEQLHSVEMILGCESAPPYMIYGPPGTGKTMTLVEAILQLYTGRENACILVCAASNSAADHILEKLTAEAVAQVKDNEIFRLNATSRLYEDVHPNNIRFCYLEESIFRCPPLKALLRYRIIISTYMSTSLLYKEGVDHGHFSHIFLDEAGQASEPETMIPLSKLCQKETVVVLAGDPKQLGPVVYSKEAAKFGLGKSYLERLFECECYLNEDKSFVTKLRRNYRCHPAILDLPSELFYKGELIACKEGTSVQNPWLSILPQKEFPVLFVGIQGSNEREGNNPSWFNRIEASKVVDLIKKLTASADLREVDIGVITPYRQQVVKINTVLESLDIPGVKVGSVEQFQGQEKEVIIVSTVRSTVKHKEFDRAFSLGFLSNPRRFNVAITRARSLLVIVGNPHIVSKDPYWHKLLWYCADNKSYQGCPLPERQHYAEEEPILET
ncbi:hypothetical protein RJ639_024663 [Escallonia herrerae]|uniref:RNA helicase n=1 Tax=Escallonia herrerae TaxID=1293975 RepID=A0AA89ADZ7_9ASTE|nr:hypothetical protein RJ639_024663 [Escallonia herrerae]